MAFPAILLRGGEEQQAIPPAVYNIIRASRNTWLAEKRQFERSFPFSATIIGKIETRFAGIGPCHATGQSEIAISEIDFALVIDRFRFGTASRKRAVPGTSCTHQDSLRCRILNGPGLAAIQAASQQMLLRLFAINSMAIRPQIFVVTCTKTDQDLISPIPNAMIRGDPGESSLFVVYENVFRGQISIVRYWNWIFGTTCVVESGFRIQPSEKLRRGVGRDD